MSQLKQLIAKGGLEHATKRFAEIIGRKLRNEEIAYQFIIKELDGASLGNAAMWPAQPHKFKKVHN